MRRAALLLALLAAPACGRAALAGQARAANAVALLANAQLSALVARYRDEGLAAIRAAPDAATAEASLGTVRTRWSRVWGLEPDGSPCRGVGVGAGQPCAGGAWQALQAAHDAWALALERAAAGQPFDAATAARLGADLGRTYCGARGALPPGATLPDPPAPLACGAGR